MGERQPKGQRNRAFAFNQAVISAEAGIKNKAKTFLVLDAA
jgi:hypothetical protein